jgi:hypothetical protein
MATETLFAEELPQVLGEPVEHAQHFFPGNRQLHPGLLPRLLRRTLGKRRVDDALPSFAVAVIAVTPTRVAIYETSTMSGRFELTQPFAIWRREQITTTAERVELSSVSSDPGSGNTRSHSAKVVRLHLTTPDGPFMADLPAGDRHSTDVAHALGAKVSPARG